MKVIVGVFGENVGVVVEERWRTKGGGKLGIVEIRIEIEIGIRNKIRIRIKRSNKTSIVIVIFIFLLIIPIIIYQMLLRIIIF